VDSRAGVTTDPIIRVAAGAVLVSAFIASLAVVVHGYWLNPGYTIPPLIEGILSSALGAAFTLLGVHLGSVSTQAAVQSTTQAVREVANGPALPKAG
jgi:hypothetical protein